MFIAITKNLDADPRYIIQDCDLCHLSVPVGVAENVRAYPYNSSAIVVNWVAVPNTRESIKGVLLGYRVCDGTLPHGDIL